MELKRISNWYYCDYRTIDKYTFSGRCARFKAEKEFLLIVIPLTDQWKIEYVDLQHKTRITLRDKQDKTKYLDKIIAKFNSIIITKYHTFEPPSKPYYINETN